MRNPFTQSRHQQGSQTRNPAQRAAREAAGDQACVDGNARDPKCPTHAIETRLVEAERICEAAGQEHILEAWCILDSSARILASGKRAASLFGFTIADMPEHLFDLVHIQDRPQIGCLLTSGVVLDEPLFFRPLRKAGDAPLEWVELVRKTRIEGAQNGAAIYTFRDISNLKAAEQRASQLAARAEQASITKSRFLANTSHELRTPLNAILGFSELLANPIADAFDEAKKTEYAKLIHESATHLLDVLNGILDMSKIENGMYEIFPSRFELASCLRTTTAIMRGQAELKGVEIACDGLEEAPPIVADEKAIRQVLINVVSNAIKFSPSGSVVKVRCSRSARFVRLVVEDNGIGISPENMAKLGQPFFQADSKYDRKYEGTGLGLSVVKGLVSLHGGEVTFKSERNKGTTVSIILPINAPGSRAMPTPDEVTIVTLPTSGEPAEIDQSANSEKPRLLRSIA